MSNDTDKGGAAQPGEILWTYRITTGTILGCDLSGEKGGAAPSASAPAPASSP